MSDACIGCGQEHAGCCYFDRTEQAQPCGEPVEATLRFRVWTDEQVPRVVWWRRFFCAVHVPVLDASDVALFGCEVLKVQPPSPTGSGNLAAVP